MFIPLEYIWLPIAAFLAYFPCLNGPFIFDDKDCVLENRNVQTGNWRAILKTGHLRKLTLITYALQCLWPQTSRSFHIVNVLIHSAVGLVVFQIFKTQVDPGLALMGAVLFVVQPFAANAVGYITGRASMLATLFGYLGIWAILAGHPLLAVPALILAVFAREDAGAFGLTYAAVSWIHGDSLWLLFLLLPSLTLIPLFLVTLHRKNYRWFSNTHISIRDFFKHTGHASMVTGGLPGSLPFPHHALTVFVESILHYPFWLLGLKQAPYHGSGMPVPSKTRTILALAMTGAVLGVAALVPALRLPLTLCFLGPWLVYIFIPLPDQLMEYRNYHSAIALPFVLVQTIEHPYIWMLILIGMSINTAWQAKAFSSGIEFWTASIYRGSGEKSRAYQELGAELKDRNRLPEARAHFVKAIELNPRLAPAMRNLAWIEYMEGKIPKAVEWLETCVSRCPQHAVAHEELGRMYESAQRFKDAENAYRRATELDPNMDFAHNRIGMKHFSKQEYVAAKEAFARAQKAQPQMGDYRWNLACTLKELGEKEAAREALKGFPREIQMTDSMVVPKGMKAVMA